MSLSRNPLPSIRLREDGRWHAPFVHSLPLYCPAPALLTVQDLSWERDPSVFGSWDLLTFKIFVRRSVRQARHVFAISEFSTIPRMWMGGCPRLGAD